MSVSMVNGNHEITKTKEENIFPPPGFGPWSSGIENQCVTNELHTLLFNSMDFLQLLYNSY